VEKIRSFAMNAAEQQNGKVEFHDETKALPLINDPNLTKRVLLSASRIVGEENVVDMPVKLSSEDFSFYLSEKPGVFVRLGTRNETKGYTTMPHNNDFLIDEDALEIGSKVQVQLVLDNMNGISS
jgi:metal-dependent amidase/aminoacylase/carboxypeptidase family protein